MVGKRFELGRRKRDRKSTHNKVTAPESYPDDCREETSEGYVLVGRGPVGILPMNLATSRENQNPPHFNTKDEAL